MKLNHKGYDGAVADANAFLIYQDDNGVSNVNVRFEGEDVWLAAEQLQHRFQASRQDIACHIQQIYDDGELMKEATCKNFLLVRQEGKRWCEMIQCESDFNRAVRGQTESERRCGII